MTRDRRFGWRERLRSIYIWHRYAGLTAALLAIHLAVTGLLLNHSHALGLDRAYISSEWLLDAYGVKAPDIHAFRVGTHLFAGLGDRLYRDGRELTRNAGGLVGAAEDNSIVVVATREAVYLLTPEGEVVDRLETPVPLQRLGWNHGHLAFKTANGGLSGGADWLRLQSSPPPDRPVRAVRLSAAETRQLKRIYRSRTVTEERVLRDLHTGRLLGLAGPLAVDFAGLLLCLLGLSGVFVWWQRRQSRQRHRKPAG
jgi:hypothetical protein